MYDAWITEQFVTQEFISQVLLQILATPCLMFTFQSSLNAIDDRPHSC